jgi:hypothetical protein
MSRARRRRSALALVAVLAWLVGVEVGPGLHVGLHATLAPHTHAGDVVTSETRHEGGMVIRVSRVAGSAEQRGEPHAHDGGAPHVHDRGAARRAMPWDLLGQPDDPGHGRHSLAHRTVLFATPAPALPVPAPVWISSAIELPSRAIAVVAAADLEPSSRGPPRS